MQAEPGSASAMNRSSARRPANDCATRAPPHSKEELSRTYGTPASDTSRTWKSGSAGRPASHVVTGGPPLGMATPSRNCPWTTAGTGSASQAGSVGSVGHRAAARKSRDSPWAPIGARYGLGATEHIASSAGPT